MNTNSALYYHKFYSIIHESFINYATDQMEERIEDIKEKDFVDFEALDKCFNEDYFITYHTRAEDWLKKHHLDVLDAISYIVDVQNEELNEQILTFHDLNYENIVNQFMYHFALEHHSDLEDVFNEVKGGCNAE